MRNQKTDLKTFRAMVDCYHRIAERSAEFTCAEIFLRSEQRRDQSFALINIKDVP